MANRVVSVALQADVGNYVSNMTKAATATKSVGTMAGETGSRINRGFDMASRGATLLGGVMAGAVGLGIKSVVGAASDLNETLNKSNVIFGENSGRIERWASNASRDFGLSKQAALEAASSFGNMLQQLGFTGDEAVDASTGVVKLAADLGSFNNLETGDVLDRIGAAMRGEYDSLQLLIPNINAARVEQEAMAETGKANKDALTAQEKAAATLAIVQRDGAAANNDFAETSTGLANSTKIAQARFEDLKAEIGQAFLPVASGAMGFISDTAIPVVGGLFEGVGALASGFADLPGPVQTGVIALAGVAALKGPVSSAFETIALRALYAKDAFAAASLTAGGLKASGTGLMTFFGGPWGLAITGAAVGLSLLVDWLGKTDEATDKAAETQTELAQALMQSKGAIDANVRAAAAKAAQDQGILDVAEQLDIPLSLVTDAILGQGNALNVVSAKLIAYRDAHTDIGTGERNPLAVSANEALGALGSLAGQTDGNIDKARQLATATDLQGGSMATAAVASVDLTTQLQGVSNAASAAKQETDLFKLSLDILTGAHVSLTEAEASMYAALDAAKGAMDGLTGSVLTNAGELNVQSEAGRKAQDVLHGIRDAGDQYIATLIEQGATADEVMQADAHLRESFINSAGQMGISAEAANHLADEVLGIPAERETKIRADTKQATDAVNALQAQIDGLHGRVVNITARAIMPDLNGSASGSGRMGTFAAGGYTGPGGKNAPAGIVHAGEIVFSQDDIAAHGGVARVEAFRRSRRGYADGGIVAPASIVAELDARAYESQMDAAAGRVLDHLEPVTRYIGALSWAKTQEGKPYVWGAVGPGGYDCSGFMSAITNYILGRNPHSRVGSTATFPWPGFASGNNGLFNIGSIGNAGGGIGHMAGTLLGVNVESTGNHVRVGGDARGASNGLFSTRAHLALASGGVIGEPVVGQGVWSGRSYSFAERGDEVVLPRGREVSGGGRWGGSGESAARNVTVNARVFVGNREITDIARVEAEAVVDGALGQIHDDVHYAGG